MSYTERFFFILSMVTLSIVLVIIPAATVMVDAYENITASKTPTPIAHFDRGHHSDTPDIEPHFMQRYHHSPMWYWDAHKHTYRAAQTIEGIMLGTEETRLNYFPLYFEKFAATSVCEHGEYRHTEHCE